MGRYFHEFGNKQTYIFRWVPKKSVTIENFLPKSERMNIEVGDLEEYETRLDYSLMDIYTRLGSGEPSSTILFEYMLKFLGIEICDKLWPLYCANSYIADIILYLITFRTSEVGDIYKFTDFFYFAINTYQEFYKENKQVVKRYIKGREFLLTIKKYTINYKEHLETFNNLPHPKTLEVVKCYIRSDGEWYIELLLTY